MNYEDIKIDNNRTIRVVRDDLIKGGTKILGLIPYLKELIQLNPNIKEFVYASPAYGYAQVAITIAATSLGRSAVIFVAKRNQRHPNTLLAEKLGARIMEVPYGYLVVV